MSSTHTVGRRIAGFTTGAVWASRVARLVLVFLLALLILGGGGLARADTIPCQAGSPPGCQNCTFTGPSLLLGEFHDFNDDGAQDGPISPPPAVNRDGDIFLYQAVLGFSQGISQCAYSGGDLCITPPG